MQYVTPIANLLTMSRNSKLGALYQHPTVEKTVVSNFHSTTQSAQVLSSQSHAVLAKKETKPVLAKHARPGEALKHRKKSHENQAPPAAKNLESLKEKQRNMVIGSH